MPTKADPTTPVLLTVVDPEDVRTVRIGGEAFDDANSRIRTRYTVIYEGKPGFVDLLVPMDEFGSYVVALLNSFGFPEGDLNYVAERLMRVITQEVSPTTPGGTS
jgi:hypothetical protein